MLYTIGHGNRSWEQFLQILKEYNCRYLIDVRSVPSSKFNPDFNSEVLEGKCCDAGIKYIFMGDTLGGRPKNKKLYDENGHADYNLMSNDEHYKRSTARLVKASQLQENTFVMCSELCPSQCHRSKLIGETLSELGFPPIHINKQGKVSSQHDVINEITRGQSDLFGDDSKLKKSRGRYA